MWRSGCPHLRARRSRWWVHLLGAAEEVMWVGGVGGGERICEQSCQCRNRTEDDGQAVGCLPAVWQNFPPS